MPSVFVPPLLRNLTENRVVVAVEGDTVREVIDNLEAGYPGIKDRICEDDRIRPTIAVAVDGQISNQGMRRPVRADSEVHFLPAIGGGLADRSFDCRFSSTGKGELCLLSPVGMNEKV